MDNDENGDIDFVVFGCTLASKITKEQTGLTPDVLHAAAA